MWTKREPSIASRALLVVLPLVALLGGAVTADEEVAPRVSIPLVGIDGIDPENSTHLDPVRLEAVSGLSAALVRTVPIPWERIEPHAPVMGGRHLHDWEPLDAVVSRWQAAGFDPVLVLTPRAEWAALPRESTAYIRELSRSLPVEEAAVLAAAAEGCGPPRKDAWVAWEVFIQHVVERYDRDGKDDMPGLARKVGWIQVCSRPASPDDWLGSAQDYLRLLHHASQGAAKASAGVRIAHGAVDFQALAHTPVPDERGLRRRLADRHRRAPAAVLFEARRALDFSLLTLSLRGIFRAVPQVGSDHLADTATDLAWVRAVVDEGAGVEAEVWLVDDPPAKLGSPSWEGAGGPKSEEERVRARCRARARAGSAADDERRVARAWLATGRAYDIVRTLGEASAAGADRVFFGGDVGLDTFVVPGQAEGTWERTPAWYALRQATRLLTGHGRVEAARVGQSAFWWRFSFPARGKRSWVLAVAMNPDLSWAGDPREGWPVKEVAIPVPNGPHVVEQLSLDGTEPTRRQVRVTGGSLRLLLTPAPVWIYPDV